MGIDEEFGPAFYKAQDAAMSHIPQNGTVFISVKDADKEKVVGIAKKFQELGFSIVSTKGTARFLQKNDIPAEAILKIIEGSPNVSDWIKDKKIHLIINTPNGKGPMLDETKIRSLAVSLNIPCITTLNAARATLAGLSALKKRDLEVLSLRDYHAKINGAKV